MGRRGKAPDQDTFAAFWGGDSRLTSPGFPAGREVLEMAAGRVRHFRASSVSFPLWRIRDHPGAGFCAALSVRFDYGSKPSGTSGPPGVLEAHRIVRAPYSPGSITPAG